MGNILAGKPVVNYVEKNISTTVNQLMESVNTTNFKTIVWLFSIEDTVQSFYLTGKITATHKNAANPTWNINNLVGDDIDYAIDLVLNSGSIELYFQNNESNAIKVKVGRESI